MDQNLKKNKGINTRYNPSVIAKTSTAGITLISLVVTIIVLIILAEVSINLILGEDGIISMAKRAKKETEDSVWIESVKIIMLEAKVNKNQIEKITDEELANANRK